MGRIAPRKRKISQVYQPLLRVWLHLSQGLKPGSTEELPGTIEEPNNGKRQGFRTIVLKIWHLPDSFHWMEPLPGFHRRWLIIFAAVLLLSLLWPYSNNSPPRSFPVTNSQENRIPLQAELQNNGQQQPTAPFENDNWQRYQIQPGQTLAQLFRNNSLPVNEVFAMAQVEGSDKPLSNLKAGQEVRIERGTNGVISALSITTADNSEALFRRQTDGSYLRIR